MFAYFNQGTGRKPYTDFLYYMLKEVFPDELEIVHSEKAARYRFFWTVLNFAYDRTIKGRMERLHPIWYLD